MKNHKFLFWVGIVVIVLPFLGIPQSWKSLISFLVGIVIVSVALIVRHDEKLAEMEGHDEPVFEESEAEPVLATSDGVVPSTYVHHDDDETLFEDDEDDEDDEESDDHRYTDTDDYEEEE